MIPKKDQTSFLKKRPTSTNKMEAGTPNTGEPPNMRRQSQANAEKDPIHRLS